MYARNPAKLDAVKGEDFDIKDEHGAIILPIVWKHIVLPSTTISLHFYERHERSRTFSPEPQIRRPTRTDTGLSSNELPARERPTVTFNDREGDVGTSEDEALEVIRARSDSESTLSDIEIESASTTSKQESVEDAPRPPTWTERAPIDACGNPLSFKIDTMQLHGLDESHKQLETEQDKPKSLVDPSISSRSLETMRITKALSIESETRSKIQVHILPGPENARARANVSITWHHLTAGALNFTRYRDACLDIPQLSERLRKLTKEILLKIEKHKVKTYLDGLFIEPGTVLRVDETHQQDPQSVIFSCVPYYDLDQMEKKPPSGQGDRLFRLRTLMQTFYPYEPVRERDVEQAYRRFGNDRSRRLVHVPNMWIMNIGPNIVLTCSRNALAREMINSIELVNDDLSRLRISQDLAEDPITTVRVRDWDGRISIFSLQECRTYFHLEQKMRSLKGSSQDPTIVKTLQLKWKAEDGEKAVTPLSWSSMLKRTDLIFIDLHTTNTSTEQKHWEKLQEASNDVLPSNRMLPFFTWSLAADSQLAQLGSSGQVNDSTKTSARCLEHVEKSMLEETLRSYETINAVDKSFATTEYYKNLPEETKSDITNQSISIESASGGSIFRSYHDKVISNQKAMMIESSAKFWKTVGMTLGLFVQDVDNSVMLRKVWGALGSLHQVVKNLQSLDLSLPGPHPGRKTWWVRKDAGEKDFMPLPVASRQFQGFVQRCLRCDSPFDTEDAALNHLQRHVKPSTGSSDAKNASKRDQTTPTEVSKEPWLNDWVIEDFKLKQEEINAGALAILSLACDISKKLFLQAQDISAGVLNEQGKMSDLYTFPMSLLDAFRALIVFYLAIERAMHFTEKASQQDLSTASEEDPLPFSEQGLARLTWFGNAAGRFFAVVRSELCYMTASELPPNPLNSLSLGPEYLSSWLIRRLLVKPIEGQLTIGDMYREYLSTIVSTSQHSLKAAVLTNSQQFQVNHRPGKRLLRSINLLQEELQVLKSINKSQVRLIRNYIEVLDNDSYEKDIPSRRTMFTYERLLLKSVTDNLDLAREDYDELLDRCGPLSEKTKQSLEINEEDHGKAIMVFTIVTIVFLPLSFVTSYLGMNTSDIREMDNKQSLFWMIAIPLTVFTIAAMMFIGFNGDELRDSFSALYRRATGKQDTSTSARGLNAAQRKRSRPIGTGANDISDTTSLAFEAEFANPGGDYYSGEWSRRMWQNPRPNVSIYNTTRLNKDTVVISARPPPPLRSISRRMPREWALEDEVADIDVSERPAFVPRLGPRTGSIEDQGYADQPHIRSDDRRDPTLPARRVPTSYDDDEWDYEDNWYSSRPTRVAPPPIPVARRNSQHVSARHARPEVTVYNYDDDANGSREAPEYTWHKEQKHVRPRRGAHHKHRFQYRTMGNMDGEGDNWYKSREDMTKGRRGYR